MRTISLNAHYIILLKNPRDKSQILHLARQMFPFKPNILVEAYEDCTRNPYGYIKADLTNDTPEDYRLQTRIFPDETPKNVFSPIIYVPKNFNKK